MILKHPEWMIKYENIITILEFQNHLIAVVYEVVKTMISMRSFDDYFYPIK
jgi:hypothetical protein